MSQTRCPNFNEFWVKRDSVNGVYEQQEVGGFRRAQRASTRAERRAHPGLVVLVKDEIETLVPGVDFAASKNIKYRTMMRAVLEANHPRTVMLAVMALLWDALVYKLFRFECACTKESKANESMGIDGFTPAQYDHAQALWQVLIRIDRRLAKCAETNESQRS